jgi:hypothetical protein
VLATEPVVVDALDKLGEPEDEIVLLVELFVPRVGYIANATRTITPIPSTAATIALLTAGRREPKRTRE